MIGSARAFAPVTLILSLVLAATAQAPTSASLPASPPMKKVRSLPTPRSIPLTSTFMSSRPTLHFRNARTSESETANVLVIDDTLAYRKQLPPLRTPISRRR